MIHGLAVITRADFHQRQKCDQRPESRKCGHSLREQDTGLIEPPQIAQRTSRLQIELRLPCQRQLVDADCQRPLVIDDRVRLAIGAIKRRGDQKLNERIVSMRGVALPQEMLAARHLLGIVRFQHSLFGIVKLVRIHRGPPITD